MALRVMIEELVKEKKFTQPTILSKRELVESLTTIPHLEEFNVREAVYDEISLFEDPQYVEGYYVVWERYLAKLNIRPIQTYESLRDFEKIHQLMIDEQIRKNVESLDPISFEHFIGYLLKLNTEPIFERVRISPRSGDGGVDFRAFQAGENNSRIRIVGEAKKWNRPVGPSVVDRLVRAMEIEENETGDSVRGILVSTNGITTGARKRAFDFDIQFWDSNTLVRMAKKSKVGVSYVTIPVIDDEWLNYEMINGE